MQLIYGENFQYPHPHVTFYLYDQTQVDDDAPAPADTLRLVTGIYAPRGLDDGIIEFSGATALSEFDDMFGDLSIKKHGMTGFVARDVLKNGGQVFVKRITPEDASLANALVNLNVTTNDTVTFYVDSKGVIYGTQKYEDTDGKIFDEQVGEATAIEEVTISSYAFNFLTDNLANLSDPNELEVDAAANLELDPTATNPVTDESFTSNFDTAVSLEKDGLVDGTVDVTSTDGNTTFTEDTDYTIDYVNGDITVLSTGSMTDSTEYHVDYEHDNGAGAVLPLFGVNMLGRGSWGNPFRMMFTPTRNEVDGHKIYNYQLVDVKEGEVFDDYDISHVPDLSQNGVPMNLMDIVSRFSAKTGLTFFDNHYDMFDQTMEDVLTEVIATLETEEASLTDGTLQPLIDVLNEELLKVQNEDNSYLDNMEILGGDMFNPEETTFEWTGIDPDTGQETTEDLELDLNLLFPNSGLEQITLDEGHDGSLANMRRFDWEYTLTADDIPTGSNYEAGDTPLVDLFSDFYAGSSEPSLMDLVEVPGDVILDVGYPLDVKDSIAALVNGNRRDMAFVMGIPEHIKSIDMLQVWNSTFDPEGERVMKVGQTCEWRDPDGKIHRVPIATLLSTNLINHFTSGYNEPFAGDNVRIEGIQPGSIRPKTYDPDDRADMEDMNFNVVMEDRQGYFLDGQITNYKQGYSRLKEFFNIPIMGRIMKTAIPYLESKKHKLQTPKAVNQVRKDLKRNLDSLYGRKVSSIEVEAGYRNEQEQMRGDVTIRVYVAPYGSIKRFRLLTYVVPNM